MSNLKPFSFFLACNDGNIVSVITTWKVEIARILDDIFDP